ncbi:MAG: hypothetical protein HY782_23205 [Chloroflexi bacterium]|nr:hypothetical protein [Chloroflexota bacterium]
MDWPLSQDATVLLSAVLLLLGSILLIALVLIVWAVWAIRRIDLPPGADYITALRATPLVVVIILDLLDASLDIFSAPITWFLLGRLGLAPLRGVAVIEGLIPLTNFIPLMTISWLYARFIATEDNPFPVERLRLHR